MDASHTYWVSGDAAVPAPPTKRTVWQITLTVRTLQAINQFLPSAPQYPLFFPHYWRGCDIANLWAPLSLQEPEVQVLHVERRQVDRVSIDELPLKRISPRICTGNTVVFHFGSRMPQKLDQVINTNEAVLQCFWLRAFCSIHYGQVLLLLLERTPIHHFHRPQDFDKLLLLIENYVLCERNVSFSFPCWTLYRSSTCEKRWQHLSQHTEPCFKPCNAPAYASASQRTARAQQETLHSSFLSFSVTAPPWHLLSHSQHIHRLWQWWDYQMPPSSSPIATTSSHFLPHSPSVTCWGSRITAVRGRAFRLALHECGCAWLGTCALLVDSVNRHCTTLMARFTLVSASFTLTYMDLFLLQRYSNISW